MESKQKRLLSEVGPHVYFARQKTNLDGNKLAIEMKPPTKYVLRDYHSTLKDINI